MNRIFLNLCRAQIKSNFPFNRIKYEKDKKKKTNSIIFVGIIFALLLILGFYSATISYFMSKMNFGEGMVVLSFSIFVIIVFINSILKVNGEILDSKDYDLLMSLPLNIKIIISSKLSIIYIENLIIGLILFIPNSLIYCYFNYDNVIYYIFPILSLFIAPIIPMIIAVLFGVIVNKIAVKNKHSNLTASILLLSLVLLVFILLIITNGKTPIDNMLNLDLKSIPLNQQISINKYLLDLGYKIYPISIFYYKIVIDKFVVGFLIYSIISYLSYSLIMKLLEVKYKEINTDIKTQNMQTILNKKSLKRRTILKELYLSELKRFFMSTQYLTNMIVGPLMIVIISIATVILGYNTIMEALNLKFIENFFIRSLPYIISIFITLGCTTCVSISIEGKKAWILKSLPIDIKKTFISKILLNLTITLPTIAISSSILTVNFKLNIIDTLIIFSLPFTFSLLSAVLGIIIDGKYYNFDWENEVQVIKRSKSSFIGSLLLPALIVALAVINALIGNFYVYFSVIIIGINMLLTVILFKKISSIKF